MKVIRYTIFDSISDGNGAERRTAQISEILEDAGIESLYVKKDITIKVGLLNVIIRAFSVIKILRKVIPLCFFKNIKSILRAIRDYIQTERNLLPALQSDANVLLWECTRSNNFFVPLLAKEYGKFVIAVPHNLESLVPEQISTISLKKAPLSFNEEIRYLSSCDLVFCISREETYIVKLFGIKSHYLPYFPTKKVESFFTSIREKRKYRATDKLHFKNLLMLGSANNQPTRKGMIDRIIFFSSVKPAEFNLTIAGFYTETLSEEVQIPDNIHIAGTLSSEQLEKELIQTDAVLIHQVASSGALTRISEMFLAGIPVLINSESAKSYYNLEELSIYENDLQFLNLLRSERKNNTFKMLKRPIEEEQLFIKKLIQ